MSTRELREQLKTKIKGNIESSHRYLLNELFTFWSYKTRMRREFESRQGEGGGNFVLALSGMALLEGLATNMQDVMSKERWRARVLASGIPSGTQLSDGQKVFVAFQGIPGFGIGTAGEMLDAWDQLRHKLAHSFRPQGSVSGMPPLVSFLLDENGVERSFDDFNLHVVHALTMLTSHGVTAFQLIPSAAPRSRAGQSSHWRVHPDYLIAVFIRECLSKLFEEIDQSNQVSKLERLNEKLGGEIQQL